MNQILHQTLSKDNFDIEKKSNINFETTKNSKI